jgi:hypothetical protein
LNQDFSHDKDPRLRSEKNASNEAEESQAHDSKAPGGATEENEGR